MVENARGCDAQADRSRAAERRRMLEVLDRLCDEPVTRSRESVVAEIREIRSRRESSLRRSAH